VRSKKSVTDVREAIIRAHPEACARVVAALTRPRADLLRRLGSVRTGW
jgi:hypothetical protein